MDYYTKAVVVEFEEDFKHGVALATLGLPLPMSMDMGGREVWITTVPPQPVEGDGVVYDYDEAWGMGDYSGS